METHRPRFLLELMTSIAIACAPGCGGDDPSDAPRVDTGPSLDSGAVVDGGDAADDSPVTPVENVPGKHVVTAVVEGVPRSFIVYVPEKARGTTPVPVVFVVHGTSQDGEHFYEESRWKEKADEVGLIAVFPTALVYCLKEDENGDGDFDDPGEQRVTEKWASGALGDPTKIPLCTAAEVAALAPGPRAKADHPLYDDVAFFVFMMDYLSKSYVHDAHRVYATGFSNGASMTSRLGNELPDRFAAVAAHAGTMTVTPVPAAKPITFVFTLGNLDDRFAPSGPLPLGESIATTPMFEKIVSPYLTSAQLEGTYTYDSPRAGTRDISRFVYSTSKIGASNAFTAALIEGCFHQYPNGINHPLVLADALWDIFSKHSLP